MQNIQEQEVEEAQVLDHGKSYMENGHIEEELIQGDQWLHSLELGGFL